jgi:hypothetical protein
MENQLLFIGSSDTYTHLKSRRKKTEAFQSSVLCTILGRESEELRNLSKRSPNEEFYN